MVVRKVSRKIIEGFGYIVTEAENGQEALSRCKASMPHLIMLDMEMPVMTGMEFIMALRASPGGTDPKVVFCTTKNGTYDIHGAIDAGADEYVVKPFDAATMKATLQRIGAA